MNNFVITFKPRKKERKGWLEVMDCFDTSGMASLENGQSAPHVALRKISLKPGMGFVPAQLQNTDLFILPLQGVLVQRNEQGEEHYLSPNTFFAMSSGKGLNSYKFNDSATENFTGIVLEMGTRKPFAEPYCEVLTIPSSQDGLVDLLPAGSQTLTRANTHLLKAIRGRLDTDTRIFHPVDSRNLQLLYLLQGHLKVNKESVREGGTIALFKTDELDLVCSKEAAFLLFEIAI